jgi:hypothetical protein
VHGLDQRAAEFLPHPAAFLGGLPPDIGLDLIQCRDPPQGFLRKQRLRGNVDLVKLATRMGPTERQLGSIIRLHQAAEPGIAIDLKQPTKALEVKHGMVRLAILAVDVGRGGMPRSLPRPIVDGIAPKPPGFGAAIAGVEHWQCRVVGKHLGRRQNRAQHQFVQWGQPPAGPTHPVA